MVTLHCALTGLVIPAFLLITVSGSASGNSAPVGDPGYCAPLDAIVDAAVSNKALKPLKRKALGPIDRKGPLQFYGQKNLTKPVLEAYLDRAIVHMNLWDERSRVFLRDTGTKFVHWADLGWVRLYTDKDWEQLTADVDAVHSTDWGQNVMFECGIMEAIGRDSIDSTPVPEWMLKTLNDLGIQEKRLAGPKGKNYFCYEAMFDRNASDWGDKYIGRWCNDPANEQSVPDLTMLETQLYYAYLIAEYIDAGFEGVMFGQTMLTGGRDKDNIALNNICRFARRWAEARAYRRAVTLTSHVWRPTDYPVSPPEKARPLFTHLTWPTRLSYTDDQPLGMQFGPDVAAKGRRQGGKEIIRLLELPHDLPILFEIDNYEMAKGPSAVCDEGYDEITAYTNKSPKQRAAFLKHYYFECRKWRNAEGNARAHLALPGYRCLNTALSQHTLENGQPSKPTAFYLPFKEDGGEEEVIRELFQQARTIGDGEMQSE